jgi:mRNA-degrading endonuclease RelE of RelBE toxin-antitoxin system
VDGGRGPYRLIYGLDEEAHIVTLPTLAHRADVHRQR